MENNHLNSPNFLHKEQGKDNTLNGIDTAFEFDKYGIGIEDIKAETKQLIKQGNEAAEQKANQFPVEIFPSLFQELIKECNKALNFPTDYTGTAILAAVSTAIGKSAKLKVKSHWYEFAAFYFGLIGNAGANKSHPLDLAFKPFEDIDRVVINSFEKEYKKYEAFQALSKKEKESQPEQIEKPVLKKSILHNFTPEILHQRLTDNDRGCTVVSDELATWLEGMNNYSKGDQTSGYLSIWSNKGTSIDRVSKAVPLWLPQPFLNIIGALQLRVLQRLFPTGKTDNGFLQRFLFALVEGAEKQPINDFEINETLLIEYSKWIEDYRLANPIFIDPETQKPRPKLYYWSNEAKQYFYKWNKVNTDTVNENADTLKGEIFSKFDIHFARLSLVLQIMNDYSTNEISLSSVKGAEKLCTYFQRNAMKVLNILENGNQTDNLPQDKIILYQSLPKVFTTETGLQIANNLNVPERTFKRFLNDKDLFNWIKRGEYEKRF
jgi:hypothetical protein